MADLLLKGDSISSRSGSELRTEALSKMLEDSVVFDESDERLVDGGWGGRSLSLAVKLAGESLSAEALLKSREAMTTREVCMHALRCASSWRHLSEQ